jgi:hypothetical protein
MQKILIILISLFLFNSSVLASTNEATKAEVLSSFKLKAAEKSVMAAMTMVKMKL